MNAEKDEDTTEREHSAEEIETIVVDGEDVIEAMNRNHRDAHESRDHVLRVTPPLEGEKRATPHVSEHGTHYPLEMDEKPLHLGPQVFLAGEEHPADLPDDLHHPDREVEKQIFNDHDDADDFEEWWNEAVDLWESRVRQHFNDKTATLVENNMQGPETEVEIRFEERAEAE